MSRGYSRQQSQPYLFYKEEINKLLGGKAIGRNLTKNLIKPSGQNHQQQKV